MLGELKFEFSREEILERVKTNRDKHAQEFTDALEGYYLEVEDQLLAIAKEARGQVKLAKDSKEPKVRAWSVNARQPEDHTADYDRIIDMLTLAKGENIELDENEFAQYVRDEWSWKRAFTESASHYHGIKLSKAGL